MSLRSPPPEGLGAFQPDLEIIPAGHILWRSHQTRFGAVWFSRDATQRFDDPGRLFGVMYLSFSDVGALAETVLHGRLKPKKDGRLEVQKSLIDARSLAQFQVRQPLTLVRLANGGHVRLRIDASLTTTGGKDAYRIAGNWSNAIHSTWPDVDGLMYRARHLDSETSIALFDRAQHKLAAPVSAGISSQVLNSFLRRCHCTLV